jgi:DASH complex subunit DAD2
MSYNNRPLASHLRNPSSSLNSSQPGQSPVLIARIAEKKAELANLKELQALSAGLADQMQMLAEKLTTLSDGTEGKREHMSRVLWRGFRSNKLWKALVYHEC